MQGTHGSHPESAQVRQIDPLLQMEQAPFKLKMPTLADKASDEGVPDAELNCTIIPLNQTCQQGDTQCTEIHPRESPVFFNMY